MIKISIDEGAAFDMLSINEVKIKMALNPKDKDKARINFMRISEEIISQIGSSLFDLIINSPEYVDLVNFNEKTFIAIEKSKDNSISSKEVDELNITRYKVKMLLHNKFFKNNLTEIKLGYA